MSTQWGVKDDVEPISTWEKRAEGDAPQDAIGYAENPVSNQGGFTTATGFQLFDDNFFYFGDDKDWKIGYQTSNGGRLLITADVVPSTTASTVFEISTPLRSLFGLYQLGFAAIPNSGSSIPTSPMYPKGTITYASPTGAEGLYLYSD
tara:strand:- start:8664 stop:9107 length:444 start_codon:yes stop_codon:yes gene_type:complete